MDPQLLVDETTGVGPLSGGRGALWLGMMGAGAMLGAALLSLGQGSWIPSPVVQVYGEKLSWISACEVSADILVIGTSRVYRHVVPAIVDAGLARRGHDLKSLNLGVPDLSYHEAQDLLTALGSCGPPVPRLVIIDPELAPHDSDNWATERRMRGQTPARAWEGASQGFRLAGVAGLSPPRRWGHLKGGMSHLLSGGARLLGFGVGARALFPDTAGYHVRDFAPPRQDAGGWISLEDEPGEGIVRRRARHLSRLEGFTTELQTPLEVPDLHLQATERAVLQGLVAQVEALGAEPVWMLSPSVDLNRRRAALSQDLPALFPDQPQLGYYRGQSDVAVYEPSLWFDRSHLTSAGAAIFSDRLASDLADLLDRPGGEP